MNFIGHKHYNKKLVSKPKPKPKLKKKKQKKQIKHFPQTISRNLQSADPQPPMTINIYNVPSDMNQASGSVQLANRMGHKIPRQTQTDEASTDHGFTSFPPKPKLKRFKGKKIKIPGDGREAIEERLKDISVHESSYGSDQDSEYRMYDYAGRINKIEQDPEDWSDESDDDYEKTLGVPYPKAYFKNQEEKEDYIENRIDDELYKRRIERFDQKSETQNEIENRKTRDFNEVSKMKLLPKNMQEEIRHQRIKYFEPPIGNIKVDTDSIDDYVNKHYEEEKASELDSNDDYDNIPEDMDY